MDPKCDAYNQQAGFVCRAVLSSLVKRQLLTPSMLETIAHDFNVNAAELIAALVVSEPANDDTLAEFISASFSDYPFGACGTPESNVHCFLVGNEASVSMDGSRLLTTNALEITAAQCIAVARALSEHLQKELFVSRVEPWDGWTWDQVITSAGLPMMACGEH